MPVILIVLPFFFLLLLMGQHQKQQMPERPAEQLPVLSAEQLQRIRQACARARERAHAGPALTQQERDCQHLLDELDRRARLASLDPAR